MPKLNKKMAKEVESQEGRSFAPVDPGIYASQLKSVTVKEGAKAPYWVWEFEALEEAEIGDKRFWHNTSLSENALFNLNNTFAAFGVSADTDTDDLVGEKVRLRVGIRTIQKGDRAGETTNSVEELLPYEGDDSEDEDDDF